MNRQEAGWIGGEIALTNIPEREQGGGRSKAGGARRGPEQGPCVHLESR